MAKKKRIPAKYQVWIDARKRYRLSHAQIHMAREIGMNPKKFGSLDNHHQEPWKAPLGQFIEELYLKRFGKFPDEIFTIERRIKREEKKKAARRKAKQLRREAEASGENDRSSGHDETAQGGCPSDLRPSESRDDSEIPF